MKPYDILAIGELNVDLILNNIDGEPEVGKEKFAGDMILTLGSSTAIFAANAAALGAKVGFVGMIGQDTLGNLIRESLEAKGVDTSMLIETDELSSGATIVLNYGEDRAMVTYQGALVSVFLPNEKELMLLTSSETIDEAVGKIKPYVNTAIIKMGSKGSLLVRRGEEPAFLPSFLNTEVVDAIGAGDSFNAGCISRFVKGETLEDCQRFGNLTGAINTTAAGGTGAFADKKTIEEIARNRFNQHITL